MNGVAEFLFLIGIFGVAKGHERNRQPGKNEENFENLKGS